ncbi:MAG TPA: hypothetical protein VLA61_19575 [Ideonella sp.]|uniref:hypothetical protein n=1 Tax=Ideonella sp. TaxID=1929293 RepID=UPI002C913628|nr:hypothetical protein [Ideonella sp.]HSI50472.1 hypothetical protein [Ideonella sp.]
MKKLFLHIGVEKTGTTSIQTYLARNRDVLRARGVLYPTAPGAQNHIGLAVLACNRRQRVQDLLIGLGIESDTDWDAYRERLCEQLQASSAQADVDKIVLSNEHMSSRLIEAGELQALREALLPLADEIQVILYARRQDEVILSDYSTQVRSGVCEPFRYLPYYRRKYSYYELAKLWAGVFGESAMHCRVFDPQHFVEGNLLTDFMAAIEVPADGSFISGSRENESLSARALEYLRMLNQHLPAVVDGRANVERGPLAHAVSRIPGERARLDGMTAAGILSLFADSNARFAHNYLHGSADPFSACPDPTVRGNLAALSAADSVELSAWLWRASSQWRAAG